MTKRTELEDALAFQMKLAKLPTPEREFRFHPDRRWRFDFAWPEIKLAVEVDGGIWVAGRHSRGAGILADMEKRNSALVMGWRVLRVAGPHVTSGDALLWIEQAMGRRAA